MTTEVFLSRASTIEANIQFLYKELLKLATEHITQSFPPQLLIDAQRFREARTKLGFSKREIADIAGVKESSVADVEAGRKKLRPELATKLWAALCQMADVKSFFDLMAPWRDATTNA